MPLASFILNRTPLYTRCTQWRSQGGATGSNSPDLVDSAPAPAPGPELLFAPGPAPGHELFLTRGLPRVLNCFSPRVDIGLNCHPNLFVEFTNFLIVFRTLLLVLNLNLVNSIHRTKATIKNLFLDVFIFTKLIPINHRRRKWARLSLWPPGPKSPGPATFTACVSLGVHARVLCASVHAGGGRGSRTLHRSTRF